LAKTYVNAVKYEISATFKVDGIVDKHDIIGAIFGQSEGLLGEELDLRELQKNGKIGRILITPTTHGGSTTGKVILPSSMDMVETSILAAAVETVDKVGPCKAFFQIREIQDTRAKKRDEVITRAQALLERLMHEQIPESEEIAKKVRERVKVSEIQLYGPDKMPSGPSINISDSIIVVEGRADVLTLLKNNIKNVIGMDGSKISRTIIELCKKKNVTLFSDGDRGGDLILRKLSALTKVDFVARAPDGKEVEELERKEIIMALRRKVPIAEALGKTDSYPKTRVTGTTGNFAKPPELGTSVSAVSPAPRRAFPKREFPKRTPFTRTPSRTTATTRTTGVTRAPATAPVKKFERPPATRAVFTREEKKEEPKVDTKEMEKLKPAMDKLKGSLKAKIFDAKMKVLEEVSVRDLLKSMKKHKTAHTIVLDGIVTKRLMEAAVQAKIKTIAGAKLGRFEQSDKIKAIAIK